MADDLLDAAFEELDLDEEALGPMSPTVQNILDKKSLRWIFVGGKGGVGKTTCSSTLATLLSKVRESVLIISTDPAHNLSDAFKQQFSKTPTLVNGFNNLYAMEIEPTMENDDALNTVLQDEGGSGLMSMMKDLAFAMPGIDEAMGFAQVMKLVEDLKFEVVVFDTAPTGHTLRFLSVPMVLSKGLGQLMSMKDKVGGLLSGLMGGTDLGSMETKMDESKKAIEKLSKQFKDPNMTSFVCVCIPEFLSMYETERLVQELAKYEIDVTNIIVNQVLYPDLRDHCGLCDARSKMQKKYIDQIDLLYQDFHVLKLPLLRTEVRGVEGPDGLKEFSNLMLDPYEAKWKQSCGSSSQ
jgi:arsenite-transporting ATPase